MKTEGSIKKSTGHIRYKNASGNIVPGVTTILGVLNKPALVKWANNLGLQGIDSSKYVDGLATIGTLTHERIVNDLLGTQDDLSDYSGNEISMSDNALIKYFDWKKEHTILDCVAELPLCVDTFGGTIDLYCHLDGKPTLIDVKTCKALYPEHMFQIAAYEHLMKEHGYAIEQIAILRVGRDEIEGFEWRVYNPVETGIGWKVFEHCLALYELLKVVK